MSKMASEKEIHKLISDDPKLREMCEQSAWAAETLNRELATGKVTREQLRKEGAITDITDLPGGDASLDE